MIEWDGIIVNTPCDDGRNFMIRVREGSLVPGRKADLPPIALPLIISDLRPAVLRCVGLGWLSTIQALRSDTRGSTC